MIHPSWKLPRPTSSKRLARNAPLCLTQKFAMSQLNPSSVTKNVFVCFLQRGEQWSEA